MRCFRLPAQWLVGVLAGAYGTAAPLAAFTPVTPHAQPQARQVLEFLGEISGRYILAGQQEQVDWFGKDNEAEMAYLFAQTGKLPAVRSFDFIFYSVGEDGRRGQRVAERAIEWARRGGIVHICFHWFAGSANAHHFYLNNSATQRSDFDLQRALTPGHRDHDEFIAEMDQVAEELKLLRDAGVPVIWRPFHEVNGNAGPTGGPGAWFWWGAKGPQVFQQAWKFMFERFTQHHGLTNLLWCYNPTAVAGAAEAWYPGDEYVDLVSLDIYPPTGTHPTFVDVYQRFREFTRGKKVLALSENGAIPDPDRLFAEGAGWAFFSTWDRSFIMDGVVNPPAFLQKVYHHEKVITLDELPALFPQPPVIVRGPSAVAAPVGARVLLAVAAEGPGPLQYDWSKDGVALPQGTGPELVVDVVDAGAAGAYVVAVSNPWGEQATSAPALLTVTDAPFAPPASRLVNLSTRGHVGRDADMLIAGFSIVGPGAKKVLIRAVGPGLAQFGVTGLLEDAAVRLFDQAGRAVGYRDDWTTDGDPAELRAAMSRLGAFNLPDGSKDAVMLVTLPPGAYTVTVRSPVAGTGVALVEIYDADTSTASRLVNLSTRGRAGADHPLIVGFATRGEGEKPLLVRAVGPGLAPFNVPGTLLDPRMTLHNEQRAELDRNEDWAASAADVFARRGAFALPPNSRDAALVRRLAPGVYTTIISGPTGSSGVVLAEVYEDE